MAINPDDMKIGISYSGKDEGGNYTVRNGKKTYMPDFPGIRPPRRPRNPQATFDNDYSFLNLPEQGSAVRDPIDIAQDALPADIIQQINRTAPRELPESDMFGDGPIVTPTRPLGILEDRNFRNTLESAIQNAEAEIQQLQDVKSDLTNRYQEAVAQQDTIKATAAEEQLTAITAREQELLAERQQIITELEDKFGVEREGLETDIQALQGNVTQLEGTITDLQGSIDALTVERDDAIAEQDVIKATAADEQVQALEAQKESLAVDYNKTITDLQTEIDNLSAADVVAETAPVVADDLPVVTETTESVVTAPTADEYMSQLPADIAVNESVADLGFDPTVTSQLSEPPEPELRSVGITGQNLGLNIIPENIKPPINVDQNLQQAATDAQLKLDLAQAQGPATQGQFQAAKNAAAAANAQKAFVESGGKTFEQEQAELARENAIANSVAARPAISPIDMSKINLPANYMDQLKNIQVPQNLNFGNLRFGMKGGGEVSRIQLLLNRLR